MMKTSCFFDMVLKMFWDKVEKSFLSFSDEHENVFSCSSIHSMVLWLNLSIETV